MSVFFVGRGQGGLVQGLGDPNFPENVFDAIANQNYGDANIEALRNQLSQMGIYTSCTGYISRDECGDVLSDLVNSPFTPALPFKGVNSLIWAETFKPTDAANMWWVNASADSNISLEDQVFHMGGGNAMNNPQLFAQQDLRWGAKSAHSARRTVISNLLEAGERLELVQKVAGHSSPNVTLRSYSVREEPLAKTRC